jgi:hypothetical protein
VDGAVDGAVRVDGADPFTADCSHGVALDVHPDTAAHRQAAAQQCQTAQQDQQYVQNAINRDGGQ